MKKSSENIIIIGAGGHGKVIADIIIKSGDCLLGFLDDNLSSENNISGYPILGKIGDIYKFENKAKFIIGIGNNYTRKQITEKYKVIWHTAIHPSAVIAFDVNIEAGTVVMANTVINTSAKIGKHCIVNSGAIVEHDNDISNYVHISPNVSIGGTVKLGELTHIGIGATIRNNISITSQCTIGAGAVVVKNIADRGIYVGIPAKKVENL